MTAKLDDMHVGFWKKMNSEIDRPDGRPVLDKISESMYSGMPSS